MVKPQPTLILLLSRGHNQKAPGPWVLPRLVNVQHSRCEVRHPLHNWKQSLFLCEGAHASPEQSTALLKIHITIPMLAAHGLPNCIPGKMHIGPDPCPLHPIPRPLSQQQAWPLDEKARVLLAPHFSKSTLTLIVLANSLEFPSLPRRQSILWKWKLILTGD